MPDEPLTAERLAAIRKRTEDGLAYRSYWYDSPRYSGAVFAGVSALLTVLEDDVPALLADLEQTRYERRLLGMARRTLDLIADGHNHGYTINAIRADAADVAQRIVDEIGHPVTDEPALGPDYREQIARLTAALAASEKIARDNGFALARQAPTVARARGWQQRAETAEAEVTRLTALITAPDGGGIPTPLLLEMLSMANHAEGLDVADYELLDHHRTETYRMLAESVWSAARESAAAGLETYATVRLAAADRYAAELSDCANKHNYAIVEAYRQAASVARVGDVRNTHCSVCGNTRGGPMGHETSECTWSPRPGMHDETDPCPGGADLAEARTELEQARQELAEVVTLLDLMWNGVVNAPARERILRVLNAAPVAVSPTVQAERAPTMSQDDCRCMEVVHINDTQCWRCGRKLMWNLDPAAPVVAEATQAERHECSEIGNAFGGHDCICGEPWLDTLGGCPAMPQEQRRLTPVAVPAAADRPVA